MGPRVIANDVVGGPQVTFESIIEELTRRARVTLAVVNTARPLAGRGPAAKALLDARVLLRTLVETWRRAGRADLVVWFVSARGAVLGGGLLWLVCALRRRPLCLRLFGGGFERYLESAPALWRFIARRTFLRAELLLAETRRSATRLGAVAAVRWIPASRNMPPRRRPYRPSFRRLLFLSVLDADKGLPELLAAVARFPPQVELSICGPATRGFDVAAIERAPRAAYRGFVPPGSVREVLEDHDAVVLPTRHTTEGHPGVIIEAFQLGLPVIVTRHPSLAELVTDGRDGLFCDSGSVDSLVEAVARLAADDGLFRRLRAGALRTGERYRSVRAAVVFEDLCRRAAGRRRGATRWTSRRVQGTGRHPS